MKALRAIRDIPRRWTVCLAALLLCVLAAPTFAAPLPDRPGLIRRTLPNGLTVLAERNATPPGRVALHLVVHAGSLHETDDQRGLAHMLEHMAFSGSRRFPPGSLVPFFESMGLTLGRHQNGWLSFNATHYVLELPRADDETIRAGLRFFADVGDGLLLEEDHVEAERRVVLEELRGRGGPEQRVYERTLPRLLPGALVGRRLPMGDETTLRTLDRDDLAAFYEAWHRPWNITLVAIGDAPAEHLLALAEDELGALEPRPGERLRPELSISPDTTPRAVVVTDPELTMCQAQIVAIEPGAAPVLTEADLRRSLLDQIASWAMQRRLQGKIDTGEAVFRRAEVMVEDLAGGALQASAVVSGDPARWRDILTQLSREIERTRRHGFRPREFDDARREIIARVEGEAAREASLPSAALARQIALAAERGEPVPSARQRANLIASMLSTITRDEVSRAFAQRFRADRAVYLLSLPEAAGSPSPTDQDALAVGLGAISGDVAAEAEPQRPETILAAPPEPGRVAEVELHPPSGVLSAWLDNGVRAHHRFTDYKRNTVTVAITLAGGWIEETDASRALSAAALTAWERPAARSLSSADIRALLTGRDVKISADVRRDAMTLFVTAAPSDLESALQVAHLLLTEPKIEPAALEQWRETMLQTIATRKTQPVRLLSEVATLALYPATEMRTRLLEAPEVQRVDADAAQRWLDHMIASGPVEAAVVGDIDRATALRLVSQYLGSITPRGRIGPLVFTELRHISRPIGPIVSDVEVATLTPQAVALVGMFGADASDAPRVRALDLAAQTLTTRLLREIREEEQLVHAIRAIHTPAEAYSGFGLFYAAATTEPAQADALAERLAALFGAFAESGPTESEVEVARGQMLNMVEEQLREPIYWAKILADQSYRARDLNEIAQAPQRLRELTRDEVHSAFRAAWTPESRFTFLIRPAAAP